MDYEQERVECNSNMGGEVVASHSKDCSKLIERFFVSLSYNCIFG